MAIQGEARTPREKRMMFSYAGAFAGVIIGALLGAMVIAARLGNIAFAAALGGVIGGAIGYFAPNLVWVFKPARAPKEGNEP